MGYTLVMAKERSGLPEERFRAEARDALDVPILEPFMAEAVKQQDILHAPGRSRAQEAVGLFETLSLASGRLQDGLARVSELTCDTYKTLKSHVPVEPLRMPMVILKPALGNPTPDGSASERIWHVWFFLQFSNVSTSSPQYSPAEPCGFFDFDPDADGIPSLSSRARRRLPFSALSCSTSWSLLSMSFICSRPVPKKPYNS